jgi:regulator of sigma E protease
MPFFVLKPLAIVVLLGGLIFVHELGHFLVAKLLRVKVLRFSIGFGPPILSFRRGETEYWLAWLPLGGYVKMAGQEPGAEIAPEDRGRGFLEQAPWRRLLIALAGPAMNLILPFALFVGLATAQNGSETLAPVVGTVVPGQPADRAGLRPGDRILSVTGPDGTVALRYFSDLQEAVTPHPGETLTFAIERDGKRLPPVSFRTGSDERVNGVETVRLGVIGIRPYYPQAKVAPVAEGAAGGVEPFDTVIAVDGKPVVGAIELTRALQGAACRPVTLEVLREVPRPLPGAILGDVVRKRLEGVPSCDHGAPSLRIVDPWVSAAVAAVEPGSPAAAAGLKRGDVIVAVNGRAVRTADDLQRAVNVELGRLDDAGGYRTGTLTLADGRELRITARQRKYVDELSGKERTVPSLGLRTDRRALGDDEALEVDRVPFRRGAGEIVAVAWRSTVDQIRQLVVGIAKMLSGEIASSQMGSFIQIIQVTGEAVERGLGYYLVLMAFISVNLAIMNLLPIPVLDGGHIAQGLVEMVTRRPLSIRMREIANVVGLVLLISLMAFAFKNDLVRLWNANRPAAEETAR